MPSEDDDRHPALRNEDPNSWSQTATQPDRTVPVDEARAHLSRILMSGSFVRSQRLSGLLRFLLEETLAGRAGDLDQRRIAFECFGLADLPTEDNSLIRVHTHRLRKALQAYDAEHPDEVVRFLLPHTGRGYALAIESSRQFGKPPRIPTASIGIVGFRSIGLDGGRRHLPDLITEELCHALHQCANLGVHGPLKHPEDAGSDASGLLDHARRLGLGFVLEGSVQALPEGMMVRVRLHDVFSGFLIWRSEEILKADAVSAERVELHWLPRIAEAIGAEWGCIDTHLATRASDKAEHEVSAEDAVSLCRRYLADFDFELLPRVLRTLRQVVLKHPREALPQATLAVLLSTLGGEPRWPEDPPVAEVARLAANAARLAPEDSWTLMAQAFAAAIERRDPELVRLARKVDGNSRAPSRLAGVIGFVLCCRKVELEIGLRLISRAMEMDPNYPRSLHFARALVHLDRGEDPAALAELDAYGLPWGWVDPLLRGTLMLRAGDLELASAEWRRVFGAFPDFATSGPRSISCMWHPEHVVMLCEPLVREGLVSAASLSQVHGTPTAGPT